MPVIPLIMGAFFWWIFIIRNIPAKCGQRPKNPLVEILGLWWILAAQITTNQRISTYICTFGVILEWGIFSMIWFPPFISYVFILKELGIFSSIFPVNNDILHLSTRIFLENIVPWKCCFMKMVFGEIKFFFEGRYLPQIGLSRYIYDMCAYTS